MRFLALPLLAAALHAQVPVKIFDNLSYRFIGPAGMGGRVTDVEAVSATLRERGLRLLYEAPRRGTSGSRVNFVHPKDAGGVLVELVEPAAGGVDHTEAHPG